MCENPVCGISPRFREYKTILECQARCFRIGIIPATNVIQPAQNHLISNGNSMKVCQLLTCAEWKLWEDFHVLNLELTPLLMSGSVNNRSSLVRCPLNKSLSGVRWNVFLPWNKTTTNQNFKCSDFLDQKSVWMLVLAEDGIHTQNMDEAIKERSSNPEIVFVFVALFLSLKALSLSCKRKQQPQDSKTKFPSVYPRFWINSRGNWSRFCILL